MNDTPMLTADQVLQHARQDLQAHLPLQAEGYKCTADDLLNILGDANTMGKDYLSDILESKRTLMVIHCLAEAGPNDRERLIQLLRLGNAKGADETGEVLRLLERYGSVDYARAKAVALVAEGRSCLAAVRESHARDVLASMAGYFLERQL